MTKHLSSCDETPIVFVTLKADDKYNLFFAFCLIFCHVFKGIFGQHPYPC